MAPDPSHTPVRRAGSLVQAVMAVIIINVISVVSELGVMMVMVRGDSRGSMVAAWHANVECVPDTFFGEHIQWLGQEVINFVHHQLRPKPTKHTKQTSLLLFVCWLGSQSPPRLLLPDDEDHPPDQNMSRDGF